MKFFRYLVIVVAGTVLLLGDLPASAQVGSGTVITPENASQIESVAILGRGAIQTLVVHPDGEHAAVGTTAGIWYYELSDQPPRFLGGHTGAVVSLAFSPDGALLVSGSRDQTARIWDVASGELLHTLEGHRDTVSSVAFSPDGTKVLTGGWNPDGTTRLWDATSGESLQVIDFDTSISQVAFSPDGTTAFSGGFGNAFLWDIRTGQIIQTFADLEEPTFSTLHYSSNAILGVFKSVHQARSVRIWDVMQGQYLDAFGTFDSSIVASQFSQDGTLLASALRNGTIMVWEVSSGRMVATFEGNAGMELAFAFTPDNRFLLHQSPGNTLSLTEIATGDSWAWFEGFTDRVYDFALTPDGTEVITGGKSPFIHLWSLQTSRARLVGHGIDGLVLKLALAPDGSNLVFAPLGLGESGARLHIFPMTAIGHPIECSEPVGEVESLAFLNNQTVVSASYQVMVWNVATGQSTGTLGSGGNPEIFAVSPDGRLALIRYADEPLGLWDVQSNTQIRSFDDIVGGVEFAFAPDNQHFAYFGVASRSGETVWLVDIATGEVVMLLSRPGGYEPISKLAFSPDSTLLAVATSDLKLKILNTRGAETVQVLEGHADRITRVMFSPDGTFIVSGSWDGSVRVWAIP